MDELNNKNYNSILIKKLGEKPIAFNPALARIADSALAGLFLSQLLFWWRKGSDPNWVYKTIEEMEKETGMGRSEQDRTIKIWKGFGVLEVELRGMPRRRHFRIIKDRLFELLENETGKKLR